MTQEGMPDREYKTSAEAIEYITSTKGRMNLYNEYGELMLTKGEPS